MRPYQRLCAALVGIVFALAGFFKLMDPAGSMLIVESYLRFFRLSFLIPAAKAMAVALSFAETVTGMALISGVFRKITFYLSCVFLIFFTAISVILRISNPDMDCGCFGQALHLTHAQTLAKNIVLDALAIAAFAPFRNFGRPPIRKYVSFGICTLLTLVFTIYSLMTLPLVDYTPLRPSHSIVTEMNSDNNDNGFSLFSVWDSGGADCSDILVNDYVAVISVYDTENLNSEDISCIASFAQDAFNAGFYPVVIAAGDVDVPGVDEYYADYRSIVTLNRSNGGVSLLYDGYIMAKRPLSHLPDYDFLEYALSNDPVEVYIKTSTVRSIALQSYALILLSVAILL